MGASMEASLIDELQQDVRFKNDKIAALERLVNELESNNPNLRRIVQERVEMERSLFDEQSEKVDSNNCWSVFEV